MADDNTERAIGRLEGKMEEVLRLLKESSDARARLYDGQERMGQEVHTLGNRMKTVEDTISTMDPLVKDFARLKERGLGMLAVIGILWLLGGGLVMQGINWLWSAVVRTIAGGP